jgi:hypothetical protein
MGVEIIEVGESDSDILEFHYFSVIVTLFGGPSTALYRYSGPGDAVRPHHRKPSVEETALKQLFVQELSDYRASIVPYRRF